MDVRLFGKRLFLKNKSFKYGALLVCIFLNSIRVNAVLSSQETNWLKKNITEITSLNSDYFSDLKFLKKAIGNSDMVLLGESSHGVSEFYQLKTRLVKFLVREMGFEVIAFESGIYECAKANQEISKKSAEWLLKKCLIWELFTTKEVLPLFQFIKDENTSGKKLFLAGFDPESSENTPQKTGFEGLDRSQFMRSIIKNIDAKLAEEVFYFISTLKTGSSTSFEERKKVEEYLNHLISSLSKMESSFTGKAYFDFLLVKQIFQNISKQIKVLDARDYRDEIMADNIEWMRKNLFKGKKIIIWTHNSHAGYQQIPFKKGLVRKSMTSQLKSKKLYSIGFYMGQGQNHTWGRKLETIKMVLPNSYESMFQSLEKTQFFLDFKSLKRHSKSHFLFQPRPSYWWGGIDVDYFPLPNQHDGIVFIKKVHPPIYLQ